MHGHEEWTGSVLMPMTGSRQSSRARSWTASQGYLPTTLVDCLQVQRRAVGRA